ncbi:hypothetical protein TNCV_4064961 [Trichonephila clavipes]|uniref:Uncharacterized protein n=1 Tax=Trichonephila clavipes TaxID=2585209 RepID=A0A8X6W8I2_TRICX|nr:hypothetical protein TNCV_4064961 [Trichonephila clavipes]
MAAEDLYSMTLEILFLMEKVIYCVQLCLPHKCGEHVVGHRVESMAALVSESTLEFFTLLNARGKKELIENGV